MLINVLVKYMLINVLVKYMLINVLVKYMLINVLVIMIQGKTKFVENDQDKRLEQLEEQIAQLLNKAKVV
jgi:uncharacterized membrane protein affecting hemolysin expression